MLISYRTVTSSSDAIDEALLAKVYDENFREVTDVRVERVVHTLGAEPNRAELVVPNDSYHQWKDGDGNVHAGELHAERAIPPGTLSVGIDDVIHVGIPLGGGRVFVIFRGRITDVDVSLTEAGEDARLTALGPRHEMDHRDLRGARYRDASGAGVIDTDLPLVFNPDNLGNYDVAGSVAEGEPLFADPAEPDTDAADPWAHYWHLGEFWRYIVLNFVPEGDARTEPAGGPRAIYEDDDVVLPPTNVDGMRPAAAIARVLGSFGADWWVDPVCVVNRWSVWESALPRYRIVTRESAPVKSLALQAAGETFDKSLTNVSSGAMRFSSRGSVNRWRIEGDLAEYEACFELKKLWTSAEESDEAPHVWRQWGLNEDDNWSARGAFDFDALLGEGTWSRRRRRFEAPYAETDDAPKDFVLEIKASSLDEAWHTIDSATVRLLTDRAGIYIESDAVTIDDGTSVDLDEITDVRLTAVVQSDDRVTYLAAKQDTSGSTRTITRTIRMQTHRWIKRDSSSAYAAEGIGVIRDDSAEGGPMEELAASCREEAEPLVSGVSFSVAWLDFTLHLGDVVTGISGRGIDLGGSADAGAARHMIDEIAYDFVSQGTSLGFRTLRDGA